MASIAVLPVLLGPRRRLRDPVPGARGGGGRPRARCGAPRRCRRSRPRRWRPWSASSCCCSRRCRWCAASACCWWSAIVVALRARAHRGRRAALLACLAPAAGGRTARWRARCAAPASWPTGPRRRRWRARAAAGAASGRGAVRRRAAAAGAGAGRRPRRGGGGLGGGLADRGRLRHPAARAAGPARGARPRRAAGGRPGVAGEIDVVVEGEDLTDPAVVTWMRDYQGGLLERYGYSADATAAARPSCARRCRCPTSSATRRGRRDPRADPRAARRRAAVLLAGA